MKQHLFEGDQSYQSSAAEPSTLESLSKYASRLNGSPPETNDALASQYRPVLQLSQAPAAETYGQFRDRLNVATALAGTSEFFSGVAEATGGFVQVDPAYGCLPMLMGGDHNPVLLYEFIEEWDSLTDYDELQERLPNLTFIQVAGAIGFLRKLAQFNVESLDIDALAEGVIEKDLGFQAVVRKALEDKETTRVLNPDQRDG